MLRPDMQDSVSTCTSAFSMRGLTSETSYLAPTSITNLSLGDSFSFQWGKARWLSKRTMHLLCLVSPAGSKTANLDFQCPAARPKPPPLGDLEAVCATWQAPVVVADGANLCESARAVSVRLAQLPIFARTVVGFCGPAGDNGRGRMNRFFFSGVPRRSASTPLVPGLVRFRRPNFLQLANTCARNQTNMSVCFWRPGASCRGRGRSSPPRSHALSSDS